MSLQEQAMSVQNIRDEEMLWEALWITCFIASDCDVVFDVKHESNRW